MGKRRRDMLKAVSLAAGSGTLWSAGLTGEQGNIPSSKRETVTGIGGFFFRAHDPQMLAQWYQDHLGVLITPKSYNDPVWRQTAGVTVFTPFPDRTDFFGNTTKQWMINFRVSDLQALTKQLEAAGIAVKLDPKTYPNGRFARIHDPEGNPIELWEPHDPPR